MEDAGNQEPTLAAMTWRDALAHARRSAPTSAEAALEQLLNQLGDGALAGTFEREHRLGNWIVDFYFPAIRMAIEVDGGYHRAQSRWRKDLRKTADLKAQGVTLLRLTNAQALGDRIVLVKLLRAAWLNARLARASVGDDGIDKPGHGGHRVREPMVPYFVPPQFIGGAFSPA